MKTLSKKYENIDIYDSTVKSFNKESENTDFQTDFSFSYSTEESEINHGFSKSQDREPESTIGKEDESEEIFSDLKEREIIYGDSESWVDTKMFAGQILEITDATITVEYLADKEKRDYRIREFPRFYFEHIENLNTDTLICIRIRTKPGSHRIDILNAKGLKNVSKENFEYKVKWSNKKSSFGETLPKEW